MFTLSVFLQTIPRDVRLLCLTAKDKHFKATFGRTSCGLIQELSSRDGGKLDIWVFKWKKGLQCCYAALLEAKILGLQLDIILKLLRLPL